jgi:hypothetical protein
VGQLAHHVLVAPPQWDMSAHKLLCVPEGMKSAASLPNMLAMRACKASTVGSSPNTSSPTGAACMASRMAGVGRVTVSLRKIDARCKSNGFMVMVFKKFASMAWPCSVRDGLRVKLHALEWASCGVARP